MFIWENEKGMLAMYVPCPTAQVSPHPELL